MGRVLEVKLELSELANHIVRVCDRNGIRLDNHTLDELILKLVGCYINGHTTRPVTEPFPMEILTLHGLPEADAEYTVMFARDEIAGMFARIDALNIKGGRELCNVRLLGRGYYIVTYDFDVPIKDKTLPINHIEEEILKGIENGDYYPERYRRLVWGV